MSFFSSIVDSVFGEGSSDSAISAINDYTGINLDFGLGSSSSSSSNSDKDNDSFFSPTNILGGLTAYSQIAGAKNKEKIAANQLAAELAGKKELSAQEFEQAKQLALLKASLGGGGGGGSSQAATLAHDARKTRYLGVQDAMSNRAQQQTNASSNIIQAIKNLTEAAQRPLVR